MMEHCQTTVCAAGAGRQWDLDDWTVVVAIAALSAEPETIEELLEAMRRYLPRHELLETGRPLSAAGTPVAAADPWCLIELTGRTLLAGGGFELPEPRAAYGCDQEGLVDGFPAVWLDTPADWLFAQVEEGWQDAVQSRAAAAASQPRRDLRAVLFGLPLLEHIADGVFRERSLAAGSQPGESEYRELNPEQRIHAQWLMTPRNDLGNRTPRQVLLHDRRRIERDLEHRGQQWTRQGFAPPPLSTGSPAYRYAGFGTTEVVLYFDLIRALLSAALGLIDNEPRLAKESLIARLAAHRDQWLESPYADGQSRSTPGEMIELERRRMPATDDGSFLDCDCPLCLALAGGDGPPMFVWFDGHHLELEDVFAFSLSESRKDWEWERWHFRDLPGDADAELESNAKREPNSSESKPEGTPAGGESTSGERDELDSVWESSHVDWEQATLPHAPPGFSVLAIGFPLAELVSDLKRLPDGQRHLEGLNRAFLSFRQAQSAVVMQSSAEELCSRLEAVAQAYPQLVCKSADLQSHVHEVVRARRY